MWVGRMRGCREAGRAIVELNDGAWRLPGGQFMSGFEYVCNRQTVAGLRRSLSRIAYSDTKYTIPRRLRAAYKVGG